jgi:hypothetical protein
MLYLFYCFPPLLFSFHLFYLLLNTLNYMAFQSFDYEHTCKRLFQKHFVHTKLDIYVFKNDASRYMCHYKSIICRIVNFIMHFAFLFFCSATLFDIYVNLVTQLLSEEAYPAVMANSEYVFSLEIQFICVYFL